MEEKKNIKLPSYLPNGVKSYLTQRIEGFSMIIHPIGVTTESRTQDLIEFLDYLEKNTIKEMASISEINCAMIIWDGWEYSSAWDNDRMQKYKTKDVVKHLRGVQTKLVKLREFAFSGFGADRVGKLCDAMATLADRPALCDAINAVLGEYLCPQLDRNNPIFDKQLMAGAISNKFASHKDALQLFLDALQKVMGDNYPLTLHQSHFPEQNHNTQESLIKLNAASILTTSLNKVFQKYITKEKDRGLAKLLVANPEILEDCNAFPNMHKLLDLIRDQISEEIDNLKNEPNKFEDLIAGRIQRADKNAAKAVSLTKIMGKRLAKHFPTQKSKHKEWLTEIVNCRF